jgi:hypothetical protein
MNDGSLDSPGTGPSRCMVNQGRTVRRAFAMQPLTASASAVTAQQDIGDNYRKYASGSAVPSRARGQ